jgi:hypothetical protein
MSSIIDLVVGVCNQTAVYWGNPKPDGFGINTFDPPVELPCRWEGKEQMMKGFDAKGNQIEYIGVVYVLQDLDEDGYLFLGRLTDLLPGASAKPTLMDRAYLIKQFEKVPRLRSTTEFVRCAYLTLWQYR